MTNKNCKPGFLLKEALDNVLRIHPPSKWLIQKGYRENFPLPLFLPFPDEVFWFNH